MFNCLSRNTPDPPKPRIRLQAPRDRIHDPQRRHRDRLTRRGDLVPLPHTRPHHRSPRRVPLPPPPPTNNVPARAPPPPLTPLDLLPLDQLHHARLRLLHRRLHPPHPLPLREAETSIPSVLLQHRCRGGVSFCLWLGEDGVDHWVEGKEGGEDGGVGRGADGRIGSFCGGRGGGDRQGHQRGEEGGLRCFVGSRIGRRR